MECAAGCAALLSVLPFVASRSICCWTITAGIALAFWNTQQPTPIFDISRTLFAFRRDSITRLFSDVRTKSLKRHLPHCKQKKSCSLAANHLRLAARLRIPGQKPRRSLGDLVARQNSIIIATGRALGVMNPCPLNIAFHPLVCNCQIHCSMCISNSQLLASTRFNVISQFHWLGRSPLTTAMLSTYFQTAVTVVSSTLVSYHCKTRKLHHAFHFAQTQLVSQYVCK